MTYHYEKDLDFLLRLVGEAHSDKEAAEMQLDGKYMWGEETRKQFAARSESRYAQASELRAKMVEYWGKPLNIGGWNQELDSWEVNHK